MHVEARKAVEAENPTWWDIGFQQLLSVYFWDSCACEACTCTHGGWELWFWGFEQNLPGGIQDVQELLGIYFLAGSEDDHLEKRRASLQKRLQMRSLPHADGVFAVVERHRELEVCPLLLLQRAVHQGLIQVQHLQDRKFISALP